MLTDHSKAFKQSLSWLYDRQKYGWKLGLDNVRALMQDLNNPQDRFASIHVAGTNGKGSVASMLALMLQAAGYKTGLYTSPHLCSVLERVRMNGNMMSEQEFLHYAKRVKAVAEKRQNTFFETLTAMAFDWFAEQQADIVVVETGLGGRLDATNVIRPEISIITSISSDHTQYLGKSLREIAMEKAGIIKSGTPCLVGKNPENEVFIEKSRELDAPLFSLYDICRILIHDLAVRKTEFRIETRHCQSRISMATTGAVHVDNAAMAISALDILSDKRWHVTSESICRGLNGFSRPGCFEVIQRDPTVIMDTAHNKASIENLAGLFRQFFPNRKVTFVLGLSADKDAKSILDGIIDITNYIQPVAADNPRAMSAVDLEKVIAAKNIRCLPGKTVARGIREVINKCENGLICITGSHFIYKEAVDAIKTLTN